MLIRRTDTNHREILNACRLLPGVSVFDTHTIGGGFPDIVVGYRGKNYLFEIKDGKKPRSARKLTTREADFLREWTGQINVIFNATDIARLINHNEQPPL